MNVQKHFGKGNEDGERNASEEGRPLLGCC